MKPALLSIAAAVGLLAGACSDDSGGSSESAITSPSGELLHQGKIALMLYMVKQDTILGFASKNPGSTSSGYESINYPINAYGRLYKNYLFIEYLDDHNKGVQIIPVDKLVTVKFEN